MINLPFKKYINQITPYEPGKPIDEVKRELGLKRVIKLASNENPLGTSKKAIQAARRALQSAHLYPDGDSFYLKQKLAKQLRLSKNQLIIGNGSNEIIELLARGFVSEGDNIVSSGETFLVYPLIAQTCGGKFISTPTTRDLRYDLNAMAQKINGRTKLVFIANPNNPTGTYLSAREVNDFLQKVPKSVPVCFDEAYFDFVDAPDFPDTLSYVRTRRANIIVLRTFSKSHGLAGLRIGFGAAHEDVVAYLNKVRQPFNINSIAQAAALAALEDRSFLSNTRKLILSERKRLYREFDHLGLPYLPSQANFVLVDVGQNGKMLFGRLLKRGIIVRAMGAYGLPDHVRITIGTPAENRILVSELKKVL